MTGQLLGGRYALGGLLGSGGSADVFAAVDVRLGRDVAVKVVRVPVQPTADPWPQLRAGARLDHPNVVHVLDAGTDTGGRAYLVLDLVVGRTLTDLLARGPMEPRDALTVLDGLLAGLEHAHARGVLHLDLSPSNVMVPSLGGPSAVLLDVGATPDPDPADPRVTVSPHYAAPEVATGAGGDARSDVYSAGALLFHLVTGRPPFDYEDPQRVLAAQVSEVAPLPSAALPGLPADVDRIVRRALAKDPARRHGSAADLRADVRAALRAAGAPAAQPSRPRADVYVRTTRELLPVRSVESTPAVREDRGGAWVTLGIAILGTVFVLWLALAQPSTGEPPPRTAATTPPATPATPVRATPAAPAQPTTAPPVPVEVAVPTLVGLALGDARTALAAAGLTLGEVVQADADAPAPAETVLSSTPAGGEPARPGDPVALIVATGLVGVPEVTGRDLADARSALGAAGFVVAERAVPSSTTGLVRGSDPDAGARVPAGSTVVVLVGVEPPASPTPTPTPTPTPSPSTGP
ncbi:protein kinase domain-containing protein [Cellulomonas sp.]|uniref:protein kinase domain-containing protein n=1 Tax=Cellulomonas sp. TaxID=40001 RepID=UPI003BAD9CBC